MKRLLVILLVVLTISCGKNPETFVEHINGYWEIEGVVLADGTEKNYTYNESIDFFNITDNLTGFRKKLKPNLEGKFTASKDVETLKLVIENDSLNAYYTTPFANWKETILFADDEKLKVINQNKNVYLYKRFIPLNLN